MILRSGSFSFTLISNTCPDLSSESANSAGMKPSPRLCFTAGSIISVVASSISGVNVRLFFSKYSFKSNELNQWGLDDYKLFELAKNEITQLAQTGKFNFTMATIDCHMPKGFLCKYCPDTYENRYENIYACQSKLINSFIDWCKSQSWYENTTIVLVGDHPTMAQQYVNDVPSDYQRTTYNCFINSKVTTDQIKNRQFTHMDMYPTTLAAMGFNIEGNKLALGTNLFSELPTIIEKYGQDYINEEVQKSSEYLDKNIYQFN